MKRYTYKNIEIDKALESFTYTQYEYNALVVEVNNKKELIDLENRLSKIYKRVSKLEEDALICYPNYIFLYPDSFRKHDFASMMYLTSNPNKMDESIDKHILSNAEVNSHIFELSEWNKIETILKYGKAEPSYAPRKIERTMESVTFSTDELLLEKSSLTKLGVPREVMQPIQRDFAIPADATWDRIRLKRDVEKIFREGEKELILQIETDSIKAFVSFLTPSGMKYFVDAYIMEDTGWSGGYNKLEREPLSLTQLLYQIDARTLLYHLKDSFSLARQPKRILIKKEKSFEEFTTNFKEDFLRDFNSILKRIVGTKYKDAKKEIQDKARQIEMENQMMLSGLDDPLAGPNSLTILDEFILQFEDAYSDFFGERLDIQELSKNFTREKIMTTFMYFIYTGKLLDK